MNRTVFSSIIVLLFFLCNRSLLFANLVSHDIFIDFIIEQKQNSNYYKNYPTAIIKKASWLLGYGKISKDDLCLLDRLSTIRDDLKSLIDRYPIDESISQERYSRWLRKKRKDVIKELRMYTAIRCNCSVKDAYGLMCDQTRIPLDDYMSIVLQNLHDLCYFIKSIEQY